jgi:HK97 family phage major capsid protein
MTPNEVIEFVKEAKAVLPRTAAAIEDLSNKYQRLSERQLDNAREARPTGESVTKFIKADGSVALKGGVERITFAGKSVEVEREGLLDGAPCDEWHVDLLRLSAARHTARRLLSKGHRMAETPVLDAKILSHAAKAPASIRSALEKTIEKSMSDTAGSGAEWIPDTWSQQLYEEYYTPAGIDALFNVVDIPGPIVVPSITDIIRPYLKGKVTSDDPAQYTASTPTTANTTIEPVGFAARVLIDDAAAEDSIVPLLPEIQRRLSRALRDGYEDAMVNGDSTATHEDAIATWNARSRWGASGLGGASDHRRAFKGLRRIAVDRSTTTDQSAGQTVAKVMEELMGGLGERGSMDAVILVSPEVFFKKLMTDSNVLTVDKLGQNATLLRGQLAAISGVPVVMTRWLTADMATTGLYTGSGAKSGVLVVSREEFSHYQRRASLVELDKDITRGAFNLVATLRRTFKTLSGSSSKVVTYGYNWL